VEYLFEDFRNARAILQTRDAWAEFDITIRGIVAADILEVQRELADARRIKGQRAHAGGQTAINELIDRRIGMLGGWTRQPHLFRGAELEKWKMDFLKDRIGVEVSFNHAEAIPWQFTRLNIAGESTRVRDEHRIDVGIVVCASPRLKQWARMDSAVGSFDQFSAWLREMRPILPTPLLLMGLDIEDWVPTDLFRGTDSGTRTRAADSRDQPTTID